MLESLIHIDQIIFQMINNDMSNSIFDAILVPFRHKLFWIPLYIFLISFITVNFRSQAKWIFLFLGLTVLISDTLSSKVIKNNVQRIRPCHVESLDTKILIPCSPGYSFTSSHATNHFAIGTFLFGLFSFTKWRGLFFLWAVIISFAQVYVGAHYPLDILAGGLIGTFIGFTTFTFYYKTINTFNRNKNGAIN